MAYEWNELELAAQEGRVINDLRDDSYFPSSEEYLEMPDSEQAWWDCLGMLTSAVNHALNGKWEHCREELCNAADIYTIWAYKADMELSKFGAKDAQNRISDWDDRVRYCDALFTQWCKTHCVALHSGMLPSQCIPDEDED